MSARTLGAVAVVITAGVVAWIALSGRESPPADESPRAGAPPGQSADRAGAGAGLAPERPQPRLPPGDSFAERFGAEVREPGWATTTEADLERRLGPALGERVEASAIECRQRLCRVTVESDDAAALHDAVEALQDERGGLHGWASQLVLASHRPAASPGDRAAVTLYLMF
jgi:hypothetical protein